MTPQEIRNYADFSEPDVRERPQPIIAAMLVEIAAQLSEFNATLRELHPELELPDDCRKQRCDYYTGYLAHNSDGSENMPHSAYHLEDERAGQHFKTCKSERVCPTCTRYEKRLRA